MAKSNQVHVVPDHNGWAVKNDGILVKTVSTKAEAVKFATELAKATRGELFVHNTDGTIASRNSYGNDPYPPKG